MLVLLSGCGKKKQSARTSRQAPEVNTNVDIPVAKDGIRSFFDGDVDEFTLAEDTASGVDSLNTNVDVSTVKDDFSWVDETPGKGFKKVYFDFDRYTVRDDQRDNLAYDVDMAKRMVEESKKMGKSMPTVVIDGHACHSCGSRVYNLALSEKRARVLLDELVKGGIPQECIKVVGHGSEMPALIDGKAVEGDREEQWPNRRDELRLIYS
jgi:outer membrane protein OmpA-like peptidoglycan-associated protein